MRLTAGEEERGLAGPVKTVHEGRSGDVPEVRRASRCDVLRQRTRCVHYDADDADGYSEKRTSDAYIQDSFIFASFLSFLSSFLFSLLEIYPLILLEELFSAMYKLVIEVFK